MKKPKTINYKRLREISIEISSEITRKRELTREIDDTEKRIKNLKLEQQKEKIKQIEACGWRRFSLNAFAIEHNGVTFVMKEDDALNFQDDRIEGNLPF